SRSAREVLAAMGVEVEVAAQPAEAAQGQAAARRAEPGYAQRIREALGEDVTLEPADVWLVKAEEGGQLAWAVRVEEQGYGGPVSVLALIDATDVTVLGVEVLSHNETPGLGDAVAEPFFRPQLYPKGPQDPLQAG